MWKKLFLVKRWTRIYRERVGEPIIYNLVSIFFFIFGNLVKRIDYDLVPRQPYAFGLNEAFKSAAKKNYKKILVIEFGVASGTGLFNLAFLASQLSNIYRVDYEIARTYSFGGGQGFNLSNLRPKGALVNNSSNTTPGVMTFAEKFSHTTLNTQQENRRGALMLVLNVDHPDIIDFVTKKLDLNAVNGANISLAVTDAFMSAVENDKD
jgi:hypothetical protein